MTPQTTPQEERTGEVRPEGERTPLETFVDEVKADAERAPGTYARETIVPEGGE
jgi:hypothetical protein